MTLKQAEGRKLKKANVKVEEKNEVCPTFFL
jgi:hypothetical protein